MGSFDFHRPSGWPPRFRCRLNQGNLKRSCITCAVILLWPTACAWSRETTVAKVPAGECTLSVEADNEWHTLRLRAYHPRYEGCEIAQEDMVSALAAAFSKTDPALFTGNFHSLFLGRLIDYPWLSHSLATAAYRDSGWNAKKGKPLTPGINQYVALVLYRKALPASIKDALSEHGYRITGVSVEKVLVGRFRDLPFYRGKAPMGWVPFDAQVWLRLRKDR
jgi:hypothetical protein